MSALGQKQTCAVQLAMSALGHKRTLAHLFDHLVRDREQLRGDFDAQRPGGLEINHQLELGWLQYWQIGGLGALENAASVGTRLAIHLGQTISIADEPASSGVVTKWITRRSHMARCQRYKQFASTGEEWIGENEECFYPLLGEGLERPLDFALVASIKNLDLLSCPFRKSHPSVLVMQPGQDGDGNNPTKPLDRPFYGCIFL
jgi:hypothetical protein